ncbi:MAG TPA: peroxidase [Chloroflexia bacterium]|nr:peroxidase [Chloroflexia bacterium]
MTPTLDLKDIQGIVLSGYGHLKASAYVFIQIDHPRTAGEWLGQIIEEVSSAEPWPVVMQAGQAQKVKPQTAFNLAFTYQGLEKLGIPTDGFSVEFREGIAGGPHSWDYPEGPVNRSRRLGDIGDNDPEKWEFGGPKNEQIDFMLLLYALDDTSVSALQNKLVPGVELCGMHVVATQVTYRPEVGQEPFGFMDSMSQPVIEGTDQTDPGQPTIKAGEFLLGYRNEYNLLPPMPSYPELGKNGTYLVFRKLEQDVCGFWNYIYKEANFNPTEARWLASKFVGRWPSGAPLVLSPEKDDPALGADTNRNNNFMFASADPHGYLCPAGSHVRRTNPRDSLQPTPEDSLTSVSRHRILRRGRVYGPTYPADVIGYLEEEARKNKRDHFAEELASPRGLAFIAINADLKRQFEFVQQTWINDPHFDGLYSNRDPLLSNYCVDGVDAEVHTMVIPRHPLRREVRGIPRFVTVRAGGYFFLPGISGLKAIKARIAQNYGE